MTSTPRRLLDLFCGRWGWSRAFAARGWECIGVDLMEPPSIPEGCTFIKADVMQMTSASTVLTFAGEPFYEWKPDFITASSPCEQFSVHGMKHFHPNPPYPELGIKLFEHTRAICEASGVPYVMENVRAAQKFVGKAANHAGSYFLWGNAVPRGVPVVRKGFRHAEMFAHDRTNRSHASALIPSVLAECVCDYAERICVEAATK